MQVFVPRLLILIVLGLAGPAGSAEPEPEFDLTLVLAVDASGSVDDREYRVQLSGIADAFRDSVVLGAIRNGPKGRISVNLVVWAEAVLTKASSGWFSIENAGDAEEFAAIADAFPRTVGGSTGIGSAVWFAAQLIDQEGPSATRRVIDISGDGKETAYRENGMPIALARLLAADLGVTVNGLAILYKDPTLADYYFEKVIIGPGAFVEAVNTSREYADAFKRKLLREISSNPVVSVLPENPANSSTRQIVSSQ